MRRNVNWSYGEPNMVFQLFNRRNREKVVEKTPEEKAKLLAESVALQRIDNAGATALRTLQVILSNTAKEDPKYRQLRKDNGALQRKVAAVPGALPLMMVGINE